jgi:DNA repair exonuclease SbcCD ATPase subunit
MSAVAFDTLKFASRLEAGGFTPQQARAAAEAFADATGQELTTKADLVKVDTRIDAKIDKAEAGLKADIAAVDAKIDKVEGRLQADIAAVDAKIDKVEAGLKADIAAVEAKIEKVEAGLKADIAAVEAKIEKVEAGLKADIATVEAKIEKVDGKIDRVEAGLKADIAGLRGEMLSGFRDVEQRMTIKLGGIAVVAVGVLLAAMRFFAHG